MIALFHGWEPNALLHRASEARYSGTAVHPEISKSQATTTQVIRLLAASIDGNVDDDVRVRVIELVHRLIREGHLTETPSGHTTATPVMPLAYRITPGRRSNTGPTHVITHEDKLLSLVDVGRHRQRFKDAGFWSPLCDEVFGATEKQAVKTAVVVSIPQATDASGRWVTRQKVIEEVKPHWNVIDTALQKGNSNDENTYSWIKQFHNPNGQGWDLQSIIAYLKRENAWLEHNNGITKYNMRK